MLGVMENSIESTIEKIKLQEHDTETKLKEKRTYESKIISLNRSVRDTLTQAAKLQHDLQEVEGRVDALRCRLQIEKLRRIAASELVEQTQKELLACHEMSAKGVSSVWNLRSELCKSVHTVSDQCDVWALFAKPCLQLPVTLPKKANTEILAETEERSNRLKNVIQRHSELLAERDRLLSEPDTGEEFIRIKNALRYSAAMAANLS